MKKSLLHPFHLMTLHFPVALWPMDFIFSLFAMYSGNSSLLAAGYYCLLAGVIGGWLTILTGLVDFFRFMDSDKKFISASVIHASIQIMVVLGFTILLSQEFKNSIYVSEPPVWLFIVKAVLITVMFVGNFLGGDLALKYVARKFSGQQ